MIYFVAFIVLVIVLATTETGRAALAKYIYPLTSYRDGILGCLIGLSLVFGLLSIVILLGYGLVEIPI
jgi:hypothetical protein